MGFWSTLGKIGIGALGGALAPITMGASLPATLGALGIGAGASALGTLTGSKGSSSKKAGDPMDPKSVQSDAWGSLNSLVGKTGDMASRIGDRGIGTGDDVTRYFQTLLSGDRNALMTAVAPAANAARDSADAMKRERAEMGTSRGGGVAGENATIDQQTQAVIDSLIGVLGPQAAESLMQMSSQDLAALSSLLGLSVGAAGNLGAQATDYLTGKDARSSQMWSSLIGGIADIGSAAILG